MHFGNMALWQYANYGNTALRQYGITAREATARFYAV
jgi:hypothetical protein